MLCFSYAPVVIGQTSNDVTFTVPLNLTQLSPFVEKIAVVCRLGVDNFKIAFGNRIEIPVTAGQVVKPASVLVSVPSDQFKPGQSIDYDCSLSAFVAESAKYEGWYPFGTSTPQGSLKVSPIPSPLTGSFMW
jgi:hypothetical protein